MTLLMIYFISLCILLLITSCQGQTTVWTDEHVIRALGDHGDRIADLEKLVKTLTTEYTSLKAEVQTLKTENEELRQELKNSTSICDAVQQCLASVKTSQTSTISNEIHITTSNTTSVPFGPTTNYSSTATSTSPEHTTVISTSTLAPTTNPPTKPSFYTSCKEALSSHQVNGTYDIEIGTSHVVVPVFCEVVNGEAWMVIQRREDGSMSFDKNWTQYKEGFGSPSRDFWLGNEYIYQLTRSADYTLRIDMNDWGGNFVFAEYEHFQVESEWNLYSLKVGPYKGTAGDSFHYPESTLLMHHGMPFSTPDRDQDYSFMNCAEKLHSGWWFNSCYSSNLNGKYLPNAYGQRPLAEINGEPTLEGTGIEWYPYNHRQYSMRRVEMKVKPSTAAAPMLG